MQQRTRRYSPEESVIVIERLLDGNDGWAFRDRTGEHVLFRCPGCGEDSYRVYLDSGRASCSNKACEEVPAKSEPLFAAVARLCGYDKQAQKAEVWERIESELRAHEEEQRQRELEERHELEVRVGTLEAQLAAERGKVASASEDARVLGARSAALEAQGDELRQALGSKASAENRTASAVLTFLIFGALLFWLALFQDVAGARPNLLLDVFLSVVVAGLFTAAFYQGTVRETGRNLLWKPFYRRIDAEVLFSWTWKSLASFAVPLVLLDWVLGSERVRSALPVGTFGWEVFVTAAAVGIAAHFFLWVSTGQARR